MLRKRQKNQCLYNLYLKIFGICMILYWFVRIRKKFQVIAYTFNSLTITKNFLSISIGIAEKLGIKLTTRDLRHTDGRIQLQSIFSQWLPIERAILEMVVSIIPRPGLMSDEKAEKLMCSLNQNFASLPPQTQLLKNEFKHSDKNSDTTIVFISKVWFFVAHNLISYFDYLFFNFRCFR